jgi:hypothetical protein
MGMGVDEKDACSYYLLFLCRCVTTNRQIAEDVSSHRSKIGRHKQRSELKAFNWTILASTW